MERYVNILLLTVFLLGFSVIGEASPVYLESGEFLPEESSEQASQALNTVRETSEDGYGILQFDTTVSSSYRDDLTEEVPGLEFISYIPEDAWIVKFSGDRNDLVSRDDVRFYTDFRPEHKISSDLKSESGVFNVSINVFDPNTSLDGFDVVESSGDRFTVEVEKDDLKDLAEDEDVKFITKASPEKTTLNDDSRELVSSGVLQESPYDLTGEGWTAAMWDGGHPDDHQDLEYDLGWSDTNKKIEGDSSDPSEHATHVAGTMLGGGKVDASLRGLAPDARVVSHGFPSPDSEIYSETDSAINDYNAILSQNSWGQPPESCEDEDIFGDYNNLAESYDNIVSGETTDVDGVIPVIFAAGNENGACDGQYNRTTTPSTAKNTITVGSVDINMDPAYYSSWGPTDDGRIKPTVVAHGGDAGTTGSVRSTLPGDDYGGKQGTSMAAPGVSGGIIQITERYNESFDTVPDPATVKALTIHTAEDINSEGPDYKTGWGLLNTSKAVEFIDRSQDEEMVRTGSVDQGGNESFSFEIAKGEEKKLTLVWSDYPADTSASKTLVNDLDLVVEKDGERFYPWTLSWENRTEKALQDRPDRKNPLEQVVIEDAEPGNYTVSVEGHSVPEGPQSYTIVTDNESELPDEPELDITSPENRTYQEIPDFNVSSNIELENANVTVENNTYGLEQINSTFYSNTSVELSEGVKNAVFEAESTEGFVSEENVSFALDSTPPDIRIFNPRNESTVSKNISLEASVSDEVSGVKDSQILFQNESLNESFDFNTSLNSSEYSDGKYNISFEAEDEAGNIEEEKIEVFIDNTQPELVEASPSGDALTPFNVSASWLDDSEIDSSFQIWNSSGIQLEKEINSSVEASEIRSGEYNISLSAVDDAGNTENVSEPLEIETEPSLEIKSPDNNTYGETPDFNLSSDKNLSEASVIIDSEKHGLDAVNSTYLFNDTLELSSGVYTAVFNATDVENVTENVSVDLTVDKDKPEIRDLSPVEDANISGLFDVEASVDDLTDINSSVFIEDDTYDLNSSLNSSRFDDGTLDIEVEAVDEAGNTEAVERSVTVDNEKPAINILLENDTFSDELPVNYSVTDNVSGVNDSSFELLNDSKSLFNGSENDTVDLEEFEDGNYSLEFSASDFAGNNVSDSVDFVKDSSAPSVEIYSPEKDVLLPFDVEASFSDVSELDYARYRISNDSTSLNGSFNDTVSDRDLNGSFNFSYEASDINGNTVNESFEINISKAELEVLTPSDDFLDDAPVFNASFNASYDEAVVELNDTEYSLDEENDYLTAYPELEDGYYDGKFRLTSGDENITENVSFIVDREKPSIESLNPLNDSNLSESFDVEASASDDVSGLKQFNYSISPDSVSGELNESVDIDDLSEGDKQLVLNASDNSGNYRDEIVDLTVDTEAPVLDDSTPSDDDIISGNTSLEASWDDLTGVNSSIFTMWNSSYSDEFDDGEVLESSELDDGEYSGSFYGQDYAGNTRNTSFNITIDNERPELESLRPVNGSFVNGTGGLNASISDESGIESMDYRVLNSSGTVLDSDGNTSVNWSDYRDGNYTAVFSGTDNAGNSVENSIEFTVDTSPPVIELNETGLDELDSNWTAPGTLEASCSDASGVQNFSADNETVNGNIELDISSDTSAVFSCVDRAGYNSSKEIEYRIDSSAPDIVDVSPENGSETDSEFTVEASLFENDSGVNENSSSINISDGTVDDYSLNNSSLEISVSDGSGPTITGILSDEAGRNNSFKLEFSEITEEDEDSSSSGGSGGGGGGGLGGLSDDEDSTQEKTENESGQEEENSTGEVNEDSGVEDREEVDEDEGSSVDLKPGKKTDVSSSGTSVRSVSTGSSASFSVEKSEETEGPEDSEVYETLDMNLSRQDNSSDDEEASFTQVDFSVENSWIQEKNVSEDEVALFRKNSSEWQRMNTTLENRTANETLYTAMVPDFSRFSIATSEKTEKVQASLQNEEETETATSDSESLPIINILIILVFTASGASGIFLTYRHIRRRKMHESMDELRKIIGRDTQLIHKLNEAETSLNSGNYSESSKKMKELKDMIKEKSQ